MNPLELDLVGDDVFGSGTDIIGPFSLDGRLAPDGTIVLRKQYHGKHTVFYDGQYDGEGTFFGQWEISGLHGDWSIKLLSRNLGGEEEESVAEIEGKHRLWE